MTVIDETRVVDEKIQAFEQRVDQRLQGVAMSMEKLAGSVQLLAERDIRMQERENQQQATNLRMANAIENMTKDINTIQLARADERHAIDAIKRSYPWILVIAAIGPVLTTLALGAWFKSTFPSGGDQRAVIPLVQQYNPSMQQSEIRSAPPVRK